MHNKYVTKCAKSPLFFIWQSQGNAISKVFLHILLFISFRQFVFSLLGNRDFTVFPGELLASPALVNLWLREVSLQRPRTQQGEWKPEHWVAFSALSDLPLTINKKEKPRWQHLYLYIGENQIVRCRQTHSSSHIQWCPWERTSRPLLLGALAKEGWLYCCSLHSRFSQIFCGPRGLRQ